jgi:hypothetical protein
MLQLEESGRVMQLNDAYEKYEHAKIYDILYPKIEIYECQAKGNIYRPLAKISAVPRLRVL